MPRDLSNRRVLRPIVDTCLLAAGALVSCAVTVSSTAGNLDFLGPPSQSQTCGLSGFTTRTDLAESYPREFPVFNRCHNLLDLLRAQPPANDGIERDIYGVLMLMGQARIIPGDVPEAERIPFDYSPINHKCLKTPEPYTPEFQSDPNTWIPCLNEITRFQALEAVGHPENRRIARLFQLLDSGDPSARSFKHRLDQLTYLLLTVPERLTLREVLEVLESSPPSPPLQPEDLASYFARHPPRSFSLEGKADGIEVSARGTVRTLGTGPAMSVETGTLAGPDGEVDLWLTTCRPFGEGFFAARLIAPVRLVISQGLTTLDNIQSSVALGPGYSPDDVWICAQLVLPSGRQLSVLHEKGARQRGCVACVE